MSAEDRLRFYAARFPVVEVDSTYYRPLIEQQSTIWAERKPPGFRFQVKAYSLLTGHPTRPQSLWPDMRELLDDEAREKRSIYAKQLPEDAVREAWRRFHTALAPLRAGASSARCSSSTRSGLAAAREPARARGPARAAAGHAHRSRVPLAAVARGARRQGAYKGLANGRPIVTSVTETRRAGQTNDRVELARYTVTAAERVIHGQRILGVVRLVDNPASGEGRHYVIERELVTMAELEAIVADYLQQAQT